MQAGDDDARLLLPLVRPQAVLDVVVDDEVQFLVREAVVLRQHTVYFVEDGLSAEKGELVNLGFAAGSTF